MISEAKVIIGHEMNLNLNHPSFKVKYSAPGMRRVYVVFTILNLKARVRVYNISWRLNLQHKLTQM